MTPDPLRSDAGADLKWNASPKLTIDATRAFDYPTLMGLLLITSILVVFANLVADVTYAFVDPRIKF